MVIEHGASDAQTGEQPQIQPKVRQRSSKEQAAYDEANLFWLQFILTPTAPWTPAHGRMRLGSGSTRQA
jgi:hypothetical protein